MSETKYEGREKARRLDNDIRESLRGIETGFFDKNGMPICIGDELVLLDEETGDRKKYSRFSRVVVRVEVSYGWTPHPIGEFDESVGLHNLTVVSPEGREPRRLSAQRAGARHCEG